MIHAYIGFSFIMQNNLRRANAIPLYLFCFINKNAKFIILDKIPFYHMNINEFLKGYENVIFSSLIMLQCITKK